jgi:hypothetical protein
MESAAVLPTPQVLSKAYWKRPAPRMQGDEKGYALYYSVGRALSSWERADQELATLFCILSGTTEDAAASLAIKRAYGSIESNTGRRKAVLVVAEIYFGKHWQISAVRSSITRLLEAISDASKLRDDIAHGIVKDGIVIEGKNHGAFLMPPEYNTGRTEAFWTDRSDPFGFMHAVYRHASADIMSIEAKVSQLRQTILQYTISCIRVDGKVPVVEKLTS